MRNLPRISPTFRLDAYYEQLVRSGQEPPPEGARPLAVAGRPCGWITAAAVQALAGLPLQTGGAGVEFGAGLAPGAELDDLLAQGAQRLHAAGCLKGWRDERLSVRDADGMTLGAIERAAMRPLGLLTSAVHLNAWTPDGRLWAARRALSKSSDPGMWDTLVGGLAAHGETLDEALVRESQEEAGLSEVHIAGRGPLRCLLRLHRRLPEGYQVEDVLTADCVLDASVRPANQDGEVMEIRALSVAQVTDMLAQGAFTLEAAVVIAQGLVARFGGVADRA